MTIQASYAISIAIGLTGPLPTPPATINANLISYVATQVPGYTILPGGLIGDLSGTSTYAVAQIDQLAVDYINSLTPYSANPWLLVQLGNVYGVPQGVGSNTSVYCVFTGTPGFPIPAGWVVSDGTHQYTVQDGGIIPTGGVSDPLFCVATQSGSWAVPAASVTTLITQPPPGVTLSVSNSNTGVPSAAPQTEAQYRSQVLQAGLSPSQGCASYAKVLLGNVTGVQPRLIAVKQVNGGGFEVICGGGDPYQVAYAIYSSGLDISTLVGSSIGITGITNANPGVVTTNLNHGLTTGQSNVNIAGVVGMTGVNGGPYTVTVISPTTFSFAVNTTGSGGYSSGGVVTPNPRNVSANVNDYPDIYTIPFVVPPAQTVVVQLTWNSISPNVVSSSAVAQLGAPAIANYINSIYVGAPINLFELQEVFQTAVESLIPIPYLTRMVFTVSINGVAAPVIPGTGIIAGDPESYFTCAASAVTISQG